MADRSTDARYLELFPAWLRSLGQDAAALGDVLGVEQDDGVKRYVVGALNYLFKSLDLIPDGIDDLGFLDDAFVLRVAAQLATESSPAAKQGKLANLADDTQAVREFLRDDYARLEGYVKALRKGAARGRTVDDILSDDEIRKGFVEEVVAWSKGYAAPNFTRDPKTLVKLRAFLSAKLP